jgi:hypothetical protein
MKTHHVNIATDIHEIKVTCKTVVQDRLYTVDLIFVNLSVWDSERS